MKIRLNNSVNIFSKPTANSALVRCKVYRNKYDKVGEVITLHYDKGSSLKNLIDYIDGISVYHDNIVIGGWRLNDINSRSISSELVGTKSKYGDIKEIKKFSNPKDALNFVSNLSSFEINSYPYLSSDERDKEKKSLLNNINKYSGGIVLINEEIDDEDATYSIWRLMTEKM